MRVSQWMKRADVTIEQIAAELNGLDHAGRMDAMSDTSRADQRALWALAERSAPICFEHFVPRGVADGVEVIHHGRNTLPAFRAFQKRFCRASDGSKRCFGYNEGATRPLIGPGFYVAHSTEDSPQWQDRGAWVVDYFMVPDGPMPSDWPALKENSQGLQRFVYFHTRDFMRKVSDHVSIGIAYKDEKCMNAWFTLVRED